MHQHALYGTFALRHHTSIASPIAGNIHHHVHIVSIHITYHYRTGSHDSRPSGMYWSKRSLSDRNLHIGQFNLCEKIRVLELPDRPSLYSPLNTILGNYYSIERYVRNGISDRVILPAQCKTCKIYPQSVITAHYRIDLIIEFQHQPVFTASRLNVRYPSGKGKILIIRRHATDRGSVSFTVIAHGQAFHDIMSVECNSASLTEHSFHLCYGPVFHLRTVILNDSDLCI